MLLCRQRPHGSERTGSSPASRTALTADVLPVATSSHRESEAKEKDVRMPIVEDSLIFV